MSGRRFASIKWLKNVGHLVRRVHYRGYAFTDPHPFPQVPQQVPDRLAQVLFDALPKGALLSKL
jgi:hypothetical protein